MGHQRNSKGSNDDGNDDECHSKSTAKELINHSVTGIINGTANNDDDDNTNSGKDQDNRTGQKLQDNHTTDKVVKKKSKKTKSQSISDSADIVGHGNDAKEDNVVHGFGDRDVLLGKGKEQNQNSGNVKYSEYIKSKSQEFATKKNRSAITISLASIFRFHKKHNKTGLWNKVESTEATISNKIKRDFTSDICKKVKFEIKKVMDVEKGGQDTTAKFSDCDRDCNDNSPSDESNNNGVEDPPKKNDQNVQEEVVSEGNDALSDETFIDENNKVKGRDEKLQDTKKSKKKRKSSLLEVEKNNEKEMTEIQNDYAETKEDKTKATAKVEDDSNGNNSGGHGDDDDDDSSSASSSSSSTSDSSDSDSSNSSSSSSSSDSSSGSSFCNEDDSNSTTSKKQSKLPNAGHVNAAPTPARRKSAKKIFDEKASIESKCKIYFP